MQKKYLFLILFLVFFSEAALAQLVVSLPDTSGLYDSNILIPIKLDNPNNEKITSYNFEIKFNNQILKPINVISEESLTQTFSWTFSKELNKDNIKVNARGYFPISKSGVLLYLEFKIISEEGYSELKFKTFKLNSGSLNRTLKNGSLEAYSERNIEINKIGNGSGKVQLNGIEINLPYQSKVIKGNFYSLEAFPVEHSEFKEWNGSINSTENPAEFIASDDLDITVNFELKKYSITANSNPLNYGTISGTGTFYYNDEILLSAIPNEGKRFINWEFNAQVISEDNTLSVKVTEDKDFTANFGLISYLVTGSVKPENSGYILGLGEYDFNELANLTAIPYDGWTFLAWELNSSFYSNSSNLTLEVKENINLLAKFSRKVYSVILTTEPNDGGTVSGGGNYNYNDIVILSAIPNEGWNFIEWFDSNGFYSSEPTISVEVKKNMSFIAKFGKNIYSINLAPDPINAGVVSGGGLFYYHQYANVNSQENYGWQFVNWTQNGIEISQLKSFSYLVEETANLKANFKRQLFTININSTSTESGIVTGNGFYFYEQEAKLNAKSFNGWKFLNWTENDSIISVDTTFVFIVDRNRTINANFDKLTLIEDEKIEKVKTEEFFSQPYPNPFNPLSNFSFGILNQAQVTLKIIDINGKIVETLFNNELLSPGVYRKIFKAYNLSSGVYFYIFIKNDLSTQKSISKTGKLLLIK